MANSNQEVSTPISLIKAIEEYYGIKFIYDMAANSENAKCERFSNEQMNSLRINWPLDGWLWLNPPFRSLTKWVNKCAEQKDRGCKIISIWPLSGDHNQIVAWRESFVNIIHGRIWPEVRGVMICRWDKTSQNGINGLLWDGKKLIKTW
jgi:phage N-6-adenine-methyltransferase